MKIFDKDGKYNFVDINNVFVGYDSSQHCCENAGFFISKTKRDEIDGEDLSGDVALLENFNFDISHYEGDVLNDRKEDYSVRFRLLNDKNEELFLTLYNCHNGYYSHGFEMTQNGKLLFEGDL